MNTQSEQINELITALAKCQGEMKPAIKDSLNPHFKSKFANLNSVWDACREPLSKNGLAIIQTMDIGPEGQIIILTTLAHQSGQWIRSKLPVITNRNDAQGIGSGLTYMKRYALSAIVGISTDEDDDAETAMGRSEEKSKSNKPKIIEKHQWVELNVLIEQCDLDYQKNIWDYLDSQNIKSFAEMPEYMFNKLKKGCLSNIESKNKI
jgi:hypothetical protein